MAAESAHLNRLVHLWPLLAGVGLMAALLTGSSCALLYDPSYSSTLGLIGVGASIQLAGARWLNRRVSREFRLAKIVVGLMIAASSTSSVLLGLEIGMKLFFARTDDLNFTLASDNWMKRYWHPINSLGYRDREWTEADVAGRRRIMVVGDSIASGYGIEDPQDRFGDVLARELGGRYAVQLVADHGWHTLDQIEGMLAYPFRPDVVILSYYHNDVLAAAIAARRLDADRIYAPYRSPAFVRRYHLPNFVYYNLMRLPRGDVAESYFAYVRELYADPAIWSLHRGQLLGILEWTKKQGAGLIVVIFPQMNDPELTTFATEPVASLFRGVGVPVLDLTARHRGIHPARLTVSRVDAHPSVTVHHELGVTLAEMVRESAPVD